jgi:hypothetical protein
MALHFGAMQLTRRLCPSFIFTMKYSVQPDEMHISVAIQEYFDIAMLSLQGDYLFPLMYVVGVGVEGHIKTCFGKITILLVIRLHEGAYL